jgi:starch synthase
MPEEKKPAPRKSTERPTTSKRRSTKTELPAAASETPRPGTSSVDPGVPVPPAEPVAANRSTKPRVAKPKTAAPAKKAAAKTRTRAALPSVREPEALVSPAAEPSVGESPLSIVLVTPEAHPFAKTGGLAEVAGALPDALARAGHSVTIVLPRYRGIAIAAQGATRHHIDVRFGAHSQPVTIIEQALKKGVTVALVDVPELFDRDGLYGNAAGDFPDNAWRFAVFSRAALEYIRHTGVRPSIIHAHDWQTGLVPVYQKMHFASEPIIGGVPCVFTIHNLAFQGVFPPSTLPGIGLGWEVLDVQAMEYWGQISYLKGGINFSEKITTVSPRYSKEILHPEIGFGFDGILARRAQDLVGILNGIDTQRWNPAHDEFVPASFTAETLDLKRNAKRAVLEAAGLESRDAALARPLIGLVSRLTDQKGFDLIAAAIEWLLQLDVSWVMLGSGERRYEDLWGAAAATFPGRVSATIGFDERLAHLIEAGSDMFLMPSRFEPCGLNQMYSLRYGTVPIVRATGGLDDTVQDYDPSSGEGTGFKFRDYTPPALLGAVERALATFRRPEAWRRIQQAGMRLDHSWDASAREYVKVYRALQPAMA